MPNEWRSCIVDDVKSSAPNALATGPFGSAISSRFFGDSGIPVIRGSNLSQAVGTRLIDDGLVFLSEDKAREFSRSIARQGDLIFTCWGTIDQVGLIDNRSRFSTYIISNKQMKLTPDPDKTDSIFLYYYFPTSAARAAILNQGIGSSVPGFNLGQLRSMPLRLPPLPEQRTIAGILGALDDKIELNRRVNETLEAMARGLFKSWFVDFEPVRAKADDRDTGLPKPIAELFPARLVDSELGDIPDGWQVSDLMSVSSYLSRGLSPSYIDREGVLVLNQKCIRNRRVDLNKGRRHDPIARSVEGRLLKKGDVLVNSTGVGTLGRVGQLLTVEEDVIADSHVTVIRADGRHLSWNYLGINLWNREEEIEALGEGSTGETELSRTRLGNLTLLVPPRNVIVAFDSVSLPMHERCALNEQQSHVLAEVRDALLSKLVPGELRVKDIECLVEDGS